MSSRNVVAFVGGNENGILREVSLQLKRPLAASGLIGHVIDLLDPNWPALLTPIINDGILAAWGAAGIGSSIEDGGTSLWEILKVPFVSAMFDNPCSWPIMHRPQSRYVALGYGMEEWLDIQRKFIGTSRVCGLVPNWIPSNPYRDWVPWSLRAHRMVFVKTGDSPQVRRSRWAQLPRNAQGVLEECADEACRNGVMDLTRLLLNCLRSHGLCIEDRTDILFPMMQELDMYVRAVRATRMVEALCRVPAIIVGRGWEHVDRENAVARFYPSIDAAQLPRLFADTQFVVNATPNFESAPHERILFGFAARACVVSDQNTFSRTHFTVLPSFFGVDVHTGDLAEKIAAIWESRIDYGNATERALTLTDTDHAPERFINSILALARSVTSAANTLVFSK